jgi:hypothetical protein
MRLFNFPRSLKLFLDYFYNIKFYVTVMRYLPTRIFEFSLIIILSIILEYILIFKIKYIFKSTIVKYSLTLIKYRQLINLFLILIKNKLFGQKTKVFNI